MRLGAVLRHYYSWHSFAANYGLSMESHR